MTFEEISAKLEEKEVKFEDFGYMDYDTTEFGEVVEVDQYGGEGEGETWYSVQHFVDHDVYIRIDGYYMSHHGTDFDDAWYEVRPKQKMITVYEAEEEDKKDSDNLPF